MSISTDTISDILEDIDQIEADIAQHTATIEFANDIVNELIGNIGEYDEIKIHVHKNEDPVVSYRKDGHTLNLDVTPGIASVDIEPLGDYTAGGVSQTTVTNIAKLQDARDELENSTTIVAKINELRDAADALEKEFTS